MARTARKKISIKDEGATLVADVDSVDFAGAGVTGSAVGNDVTETIPGATAGNQARNETPTGAINGSNVAFILANTPSPAASLKLFLNGAYQTPTEDYTLSVATITFVNAPPTGSILRAFYDY